MLIVKCNQLDGHSAISADHRLAEPGQRVTEFGLGDIGELLVESPHFARGQRAESRSRRRLREWQRPLQERQPANHRSAKEQIDPFDQQRRAVLQFERDAGCRVQLQDAVATERGRPGYSGPVGTDDCMPLRLEAGEDPTAALGHDRRSELRDSDADCAEPLALALRRCTF